MCLLNFTYTCHFFTFSFFVSEVVRRCSVIEGVFRNFEKLTGKHLYQNLFFSKVTVLWPAFLLKRRLAQVFSCEFFEISKNTFSTEHLKATASIFLKYLF